MTEDSYQGFSLDREAMQRTIEANLTQITQEQHECMDEIKDITMQVEDLANQCVEKNLLPSMSLSDLLKYICEGDAPLGRLSNYLLRNKKVLNKCHSEALESANDFLSANAHLLTPLTNEKSQRTASVQCETENSSMKSSSYVIFNATWPEVTPHDFGLDRVIAHSTLLFKEPVESSTGGTKRPRVDPHTLLKPASRLFLDNKEIFVQYTRKFYMGFSNTSKSISYMPVANGINQSNAYLDLSPYIAPQALHRNEFEVGIFHSEKLSKFYVIPYGNLPILLERTGSEAFPLLSEASEIYHGDVMVINGLRLTLRVEDL